MIICGIDPGKSGCLAFYNPDKNRIIKVIDMPTLNASKVKGKTKTVISWPTLAEELRRMDDHYGNDDIRAFLELVSGGTFGAGKAAMRMGVTSAFSFGRGYGGLEMGVAVFQWPLEYVTPVVWKRHFGLGPDKEAARAKASQILPADTALWTPSRGNCTKLQAEGRAEASLIAVWGSKQLGQNRRRRVKL